MNDDLKASFEAYSALARDAFRKARSEGGRNAELPLLLHDDQLVVRVVDQIEPTQEFSGLVLATARNYLGDKSRIRVTGLWEGYVKAYFRQSGLYEDLFADQPIDLAEAAKLYHSAFHAETHQVTHLAPIELLYLTNPCISWKEFQLRRFSSIELDQLLRNSANRIFYKWAHVDTAELDGYWFIRATETIPARKLGTLPLVPSSLVRLSYSNYPPPIERTLRDLALFDWERITSGRTTGSNASCAFKEWEGPFHPRIPFVISVSDSPVQWPQRAPDLSSLLREPDLDPATGEEIGEVPMRGTHLTDRDADDLQKALHSSVEISGVLAGHDSHWGFIDTALGFLVKGFTSQGIEQLLWHITTIESVLGEKAQSGITARLKSRLSLILGTTEKDRKELKRQFEQLYMFRSDLVHGNAELADHSINRSHLKVARDFARCTVLWMLQILAEIAKAAPIGCDDLPTRSDLLALLDMSADDRRRIALALTMLPKEFPKPTARS